MDYNLLGKNIAYARSKNHLTQEQLAERINVSAVFISQIETSVRKPSLETVYKISNALNTTIDTLIGNDSFQAKYDEISKLLRGKNEIELEFIIGILKEICSNIKNGKITRK
ncbi:MAG: helix-turn-helix transcriptional regulator [Ruminococcaceae bacterium]|nr:helix-turn-helix transcriptional regulator [Oscillospiraceae bacterium]